MKFFSFLNPLSFLTLHALPGVGGGYQVGDGNISEVELSVNPPVAAAKTTAVTLTVDEFTSGLVVTNFGSALALTTPTAAALDAALVNAKIGSAFNFTICGTGAFANTLTGRTGVTVVGAAATPATTIASGTWRVQKTAPGAWSAYRL